VTNSNLMNDAFKEKSIAMIMSSERTKSLLQFPEGAMFEDETRFSTGQGQENIVEKAKTPYPAAVIEDTKLGYV